jgi:hypothetical protein
VRFLHRVELLDDVSRDLVKSVPHRVLPTRQGLGLDSGDGGGDQV